MNDLINRIYGDFDKKNEFPKVKLNLPKFDFSHLTEAVRNMNSAFDNIAKDIREQQDNAMAMEFTKCIGELLRKNGVIPKITEYTRENVKENSIEKLYGVSIDELDFSEHDKVLEDKIAKLKMQIRIYESKIQELRTRCTEGARDNFDKEIYGCLSIVSYPKEIENQNKELKQRISELESKETVDLPFDPLECANHLINATYERETNGIERTFRNLPEKVNSDKYTVGELEQIAEHLLVYCKHNKECENNGKSKNQN